MSCLESECYLIEAGVNLGPKKFRRNMIIPATGIKEFRNKHNNTGVYITAYCYNDANQDEAYLYGNLYLDFDLADLVNSDNPEMDFDIVREDALHALVVLSAIYNIPEEQVRIFFSGKKGLHLIVPAKTLGLRPDKELNEIFRLMALDIKKSSKHKTLDTCIYDRKRLFRVPGSIHQDTGLYKVPLTYHELTNLSFASIRSIAKEARVIDFAKPMYNPKAYRIVQDFYRQWEEEKKTNKMSKSKGNGTLNYTPPCIKYLLNNPTNEGQRNNATAYIVSHFKQRGYSEDKAYELIDQWNEAYCSPMLKRQEVVSTVHSIYRGEYSYGCRTLKDLGNCNEHECKLKK